MAIKPFTLKLEWAEKITPRIKHLAFKREDDEPFEFIPGQFITFLFPHEEKLLRRSYSIATIQGKSNLIELAAGEVIDGFATNILFNLKPGETLTASGPFGRLILREDEHPKRYILVATGTGVTPYRAMLPALATHFKQYPKLEVILMLGIRNPQETLYAKEFEEFAAQHPQFQYHPFYSRELPAEPKSTEHKGYVQTGFDPFHLNPENDLVYLCGNPEMIDEAFEILKTKDFGAHSVRREKYISSGH